LAGRAATHRRQRRDRSAQARRSERRGRPDGAAVDNRDWERRIDLLLAVGIALGAFVLYFLTAARDIVVGDTPELAAAAITLGVPHPPGYPLLVLVGHVFSWLPFGSIPFRVNLTAVVASAATVGLVYLTARRVVGEWLWAALAAVLLVVNPLFWEWSLAFEAFPLNNLLAAGLIYLVVAWHERPDRGMLLAGAALLAGLGLANHQSIVLLGPAVLFLLWARRSTLLRSRQVVLLSAIALSVGLLPYAYVPWAAVHEPFWNWMGVSSFSDLVALITRQNYGTGQLINVPNLAGGSAVERMRAHLGSFTGLEVVLLGLGAIGAYLWQRWYFWFAILAFIFAGPAFAAYANANLAANFLPWVFGRFLLLSHVVAAPLMAFGLLFVAYLIREVGSLISLVVPRYALMAGVAAVVLAGAAATVLVTYQANDQRANQIARLFAEDILASVEPGAVLIANGDEAIAPLAYLQSVERHRTDVQLLIGPLLTEPWYIRQLRARYPDLSLPFERLRIDAARMKDLVDANVDRTQIYAVGNLLDAESIAPAYTTATHGLVFRIQRIAPEEPVDDLEAQNERLISRYARPPLASLKSRTFERSILAQYASAPFRVGVVLEQAGDAERARQWYERAIGMDPEQRTFRDALARLNKKG
jgi:Protein of unknown function (DUF2723)